LTVFKVDFSSPRRDHILQKQERVKRRGKRLDKQDIVSSQMTKRVGGVVHSLATSFYLVAANNATCHTEEKLKLGVQI
jgi:ribosomal protein L35